MEDNTNIESKEMCVLLVDDDSSFRWVLARRLSRMGISFVEAENGQKAIENLEKQEYDLLITDIYMPEKDGFDVINAARILYPDIQIILMTASSTLETAVKGLRNRVSDYLTKPIETLAIFDLTVERALRHRMLELSNKELFEKVKKKGQYHLVRVKLHPTEEIVFDEYDGASGFSIEKKNPPAILSSYEYIN